MDTKQLFYALSKNKVTQKYFDGIYSKDTLKDIVNAPKLIICNTDNSDQPGKHWVLFFFDKHGNVEFFDSLAKPMKYYGPEFVLFSRLFSKKIKETKQRTQPKGTSLCGIYCLFYAYFRCKGFEMETIIKNMKPPSKVVKKVKLLFEICSKSKCSLLQQCKNCK